MRAIRSSAATRAIGELEAMEFRIAPAPRRGRSRSRQSADHLIEMRAVLQSLNTPDAPSPETFAPPADQAAWAMLVQAMIGADDGPGSELFQITVCTPAWIAERLDEGWPPFDGRCHLIVARYDWPLIEHTLRRHISYLKAPTWHELALKLSRLGSWEFEDYVESNEIAG